MSDNRELSTSGYLPTGASVWPRKRYAEMHRRSLDDPEGFWAEQARQLDWDKTWDKVLDWQPPYARWFVGGMLLDIYGNPQRYKEAFWLRFPGSFYTGDFALRDEDGYFWLLGRADEVLKIAGHRIGTAELEDAVISHPAIAEVAVVARPDEIKGDAIVLFVTLKKGQQPSDALKQEIGKHLRSTVGSIASPDEIYFVETMPKTRTGKIMRRVLKAVASGQALGDLTTLEDEASEKK